jgi:hypothetical protein
MKQLSEANWLEPDPASAGPWARLDLLTGSLRPKTVSDHLADLQAVTLAAVVPQAVRDIFDVARGAMIYGYLYYPLYTLGVEQALRASETAVRCRYDALGGPAQVITKRGPREPSYAECIDWLKRRGALSAKDAARWHATRRLRNAASHPSYQRLGFPQQQVDMLALVAADINGLFGVVRPSLSPGAVS